MRSLPPYAALFLVTVAAYAPVWCNDFIDVDDERYITHNPQVKQGLTKDGFLWAWTTGHGHYWQPLSWLSLQVDAELFSSRSPDGNIVLSPAAFHVHNVLCHATTTLLLFLVWQRLTGAYWCSFLVAALFALHPMRVESVAWAAERKDVLSTFFGVVTLGAYLRYARAPSWPRYLAVGAAMLLSLMCKPMLMTMPFVLLLLDYWPLRRVAFGRAPLAPSAAGRGWLILEKLPLLLVAVAIGVVTEILRDTTGNRVPLNELPLADRVGNALVAYASYVGRSLWPTHLAAYYLHPVHDWSVAWAIVGAAVLLTISALTLWQAGRRPWLIVGWLWFVGTLLPVSGLSQGGMQSWADRFTYWPHIGLAVALVWGLAELVAAARLPAWATSSAAVCVLGGLAAATWIQVAYWRDVPTLWERILAVTQDHHRAHANLGNYELLHGRPDLAVSHFAECVRIKPDGADYRHDLGVALLMLGRDEEAAEQFLETLQRAPHLSDAWHNLGLARLRQGQAEKAAPAFRKALELQPESAESLAMLGHALLRLHQRDLALPALQKALQYNPQDGDAWYALGLAAMACGQVDEAIAALSEGLRCKPNLVSCASDLGVALGRAGRWPEAAELHFAALRMQTEGEAVLKQMHGRAPMQDGIPRRVILECRLAGALNRRGDHHGAAIAYRDAREVCPEWPNEFAARAWRLINDADPDRRDTQTGCELARLAVEGSNDRPARLLDVLAAAEAAQGDLAAAGRTAQRALDKSSAAGDASLSKTIRDHLRRHEQHGPVAPAGAESHTADESYNRGRGDARPVRR
jgi:tetratricopeptide (TPR) repeat protein